MPSINFNLNDVKPLAALGLGQALPARPLRPWSQWPSLEGHA